MTPSKSLLSLLVLENDPELFDWLRKDSLSDASGEGDLISFDAGEIRVQMERVVDGQEPGPGERAEGVLCLIRFVDQVSMQRLSGKLKQFADGTGLPVTFLIYRKLNEQDFKMGCPFCGQKLWVRDADLDKRGRCPTCKKGFTLPRQEDQIINLLGLKQTAPVYRVIHEEPSSLMAAVRILLKRKEEREALNGTEGVFRENTETMVVNVD